MNETIPQDPEAAKLAIPNFRRGTIRWTEADAPLIPPDPDPPAEETP